MIINLINATDLENELKLSTINQFDHNVLDLNVTTSCLFVFNHTIYNHKHFQSTY